VDHAAGTARNQARRKSKPLLSITAIPAGTTVSDVIVRKGVCLLLFCISFPKERRTERKYR